MKRNVLLGTGAVVIVLFVAAVNNAPDGPATRPAAAVSSPAAEPETSPAVTITAKELIAAYEANEAAAQARFGDNPLVVTGKVARIDLDFSNEPVVHLTGPDAFSTAMLDLADDAQPQAAQLAKGQAITARCESVGEVIGSPVLRECRLS